MGERKRRAQAARAAAARKLVVAWRARPALKGLSASGAEFLLSLYELGEDDLAERFLDGLVPPVVREPPGG